jgi:hypothetical protein
VIGIYGIAGSVIMSGMVTISTLSRGFRFLKVSVDFHCINRNALVGCCSFRKKKEVSVDKIYQKMLEAFSGEPYLAFNNLDTLQTKVADEFRGKRFLLVLDDIWAANDASVQYKLDQLLSPTRVGKKGSMVLVTTRFKDAAVYIGAQSPMEIPNLNEMDFFNLFMHYALNNATLDAKELATFQMIGKQIVKKQKGSPLAARVAGARLRMNLNALWWSYQHLNEQVRRCFAYCSMFPQGYIFKRDELMDLWIAEGFIKNTNNPVEQMNVAQNYFNALVSSSFLQTRKYLYGSKNEWFTIHDLRIGSDGFW